VPTTTLATSFFARNLEAYSQALQAMLSGNLALSQQQFQSMKSLAEESAKAVADIVGAPNPKESLKKSFDTVRSSMQNAMAVSNILSEMSARNSAAAAKVIQDRTYAALDEIQSLALTVADSSAVAPIKT
jgi:phasin family protein